MILNTMYQWKRLTEDGRLVTPSWATQSGYAHEADAMIHYYMKFSTNSEPVEPQYTIIKLYGA